MDDIPQLPQHSLGSHGNPLQGGNERAAVIYFSSFIEPVLTEMNT
jgi:hypothetical protein